MEFGTKDAKIPVSVVCSDVVFIICSETDDDKYVKHKSEIELTNELWEFIID